MARLSCEGKICLIKEDLKIEQIECKHKEECAKYLIKPQKDDYKIVPVVDVVVSKCPEFEKRS